MKPNAFEIADNNVISIKHRLINKIALLNSFNLIAFNGIFSDITGSMSKALSV